MITQKRILELAFATAYSDYQIAKANLLNFPNSRYAIFREERASVELQQIQSLFEEIEED